LELELARMDCAGNADADSWATTALPLWPLRVGRAISPWKLGGLSLRELGRRVWKSAMEDDVFGRSAQLAYYFFLALFPALIFVTALLGLLAGPVPACMTTY